MTNIDMTRIITMQDQQAVAQTARSTAIKQACSTRILAVIDHAAQMNLVAARAAGQLSEADMITYDAGLNWITAMRAACVSLVARDADWQDDTVWPPVPDGVVALAARF